MWKELFGDSYDCLKKAISTRGKMGDETHFVIEQENSFFPKPNLTQWSVRP